MRKYGIREWFVFGIGAALMIVQLYKYTTDSLGDYALEIGVLGVSMLLIFAPKTLVTLVTKLFRKKTDAN